MDLFKNIVRQNFSGAADNYSRYSRAQQMIAGKLLDLIPAGHRPASILDIGCGTGYLCGLMLEKYPGADVSGLDIAPGMIEACGKNFKEYNRFHTICEDGETFRTDKPFDLIVSGYSLQWFLHKQAGIRNIYEAASPGAVCGISIPVAGSFIELFECLTKMEKKELSPVNLLTPADWEQYFTDGGFKITNSLADKTVIHYNTPVEAVKSFNKIGAGMKDHHGYNPLTVTEIKKLMSLYKKLFARGAGHCPVTYNSLILIGSKDGR